jgi:type I restriction enzyme S subunit
MKDGDQLTVMPNLRFREFADAEGWREHTLREVTTQLLDGDWIESKDQSDSGFRLIQTGNIGVGRFIPKTNNARYVSEETFRRLGCTEVFPGDCLISRLPDPAGRSCVLPDVGSRMITAVDCTIVRFDYQKIVPYLFVAHSQTDGYFREIEALSSGSTRQRVSRENLSNVTLALPEIAEQQKIADCLMALDKLIAAHRRKLEALRAHTKALMQQVFPLDGETRPRLRFPDFRHAPEWKEKKGGELFANRTEPGEGGLPLYSVTMNDGMVKRSSLARVADDIAEPEGNKRVRNGDIAYNMMRMWQGALGVAREDCMVSPAYVVLSPMKGVCSEFFAYLFKLPRSLHVLTSHSRGLTKDRLRLYYADFTRVALRVPDFAEQRKIADLLASLDALITVMSEKLAALETHKKGLMQQLFPGA